MNGNKDIVLYGDVFSCLDFIEDKSVDVVITSPPYYKQRDYGFDGQIGQENTPEEYIGKLLKIFLKIKDKLKDDGVFFLNIGDKYLSRYGKSHLLQIPYRLAYHMQKKGWYLEDILIWYKPNHMPSSVKDRFSNTYEPILVFSKIKGKNIYINNLPKILKVKLQQIKRKHTAAYPEELVEVLLRYIDIKNVSTVLDPFAGTGTTAVVINKFRNNFLFSNLNINVILIEKSKEYINIIKERTGINNIIKVHEKKFEYEIVKEDEFLEGIIPKVINNNKYGEVYIANNSIEFLSILKGMFSNEFKIFHREDAVFFIGVKNFSLNDLYYVNKVLDYGYVLRNMIVISNKKNWFPVFMIVKDSKKIEYRFNIDKLRKQPKIKNNRNRKEISFNGYKVKDNISKNKKEGYIITVLEKYKDGFPKIVLVNWQDFISVEYVLHPNNDELIMESLEFKCPYCMSNLIEPFDPLEENYCPFCNKRLWVSIESVPIIVEKYKINIDNNIYKKIKIEYLKNINFSLKNVKNRTNNYLNSNSKFLFLDRINWGASPGARKIVNGEFFSKTRLYKIKHFIFAEYLNILRKEKRLSIKDIIDMFPPHYKHTVSHWFRTDIGGSIPLPEDIDKLKKIFGRENDQFLSILQKTALKFQTVKSSIKGKNPGDFIEGKSENELINYFETLYSTPVYTSV